MKTQAWLRRLSAELPGWYVWTLDPPGDRWYAVPAPGRLDQIEKYKMPNLIDAATPAELRALARQRYGWHDTCQSCGVLARTCGHRQPERRERP